MCWNASRNELREGMDIRTLISAGLFASFLAAPSASAAIIGVVAPKSGPYALLGAQIYQGARAAAEANGDTLVELDESCDENGGLAVSKSLTDAKASAAIGFLCVETLTTALPALKAAAIPAVSVSVRSKILMEDALRNGWPFFRLAPTETAEADAVAAAILSRWKAEPIAFIDDGTIYGRELSSAVRQKLEPSGIRPAFTDVFRPGQEQQIALVRRLAKAGATHVFIGGDRNDTAIIVRDAAAERISLTVMGGDALRAANRPVGLANGVLAAALPDYAVAPEASTAVTQLRAGNVEPEGYVLPAYAATELVHRAVTETSNGRSLTDTLAAGSFTTAIGPVAFGPDHELKQNPFRLVEWQGTDFVEIGPATD